MPPPHPPAPLPLRPSSNAGSSSDVVARVAGQPITNADLEAVVGARLSQLRMKAEQDEFAIKSQAIDQIVRDRLVEAEAKSKGVTSEQLLKTEVDDKASAPTEEEIKQVYERNKARLGNRTLEEAKPEIERQLKMQKSNERRMEYMKELQAKADVQVLLDPPRIKVNVPGDAPSRGPAGAAVTLVEFSDYQCPFCKRAHETVEQLVAAYPNDIRLVFMDYPLPMHNRAAAAAEAARCAGEQGKYWEYANNLMKANGDLSDDNLKARATEAYPRRVGLRGLHRLRQARARGPVRLHRGQSRRCERHPDLLHQRSHDGRRQGARRLQADRGRRDPPRGRQARRSN